MIRISLLCRIASRQLALHQITSNRLINLSQFAVHCSRQTFVSNQKPEPVNENTRDLIASQDADTFGTLSINVSPAEDEIVDEDDIKEEEFIKNPPRKSQKLSIKQYADMIKDNLKSQRVKEALDVLEVRMLKEDRAKPDNYIYNLLIDGCAKVGYSKKAFQLFTRMKQRGLKVTGATYTSLFNACANAPWKEDGLNKANRLREIMEEKGEFPNISTYNAMIKAFGRCQDLKTAFLLADEMLERQLPIPVETFNFLLQACASDSDFGFRHALLVWHKIYQRNLKPDIYSFNLMLRCCRDTNLGDLETTEQVIQAILLCDTSHPSQYNKQLTATSSSEMQMKKSTEISESDTTPNLLALRPHLGNLVSLSEVTKPDHRLLLLGGFFGFLETMEQFDVSPDLKTFTELLEVIPPTISAEKRLISRMKKTDIKCDIDFFNLLIKKRSMRFDYSGAREVLEMIERARLHPDIVTYGVLALGCTTQEEARSLQEEMHEKGIKMNIPILGAMMRQACVRRNFGYVLEVLELIKYLKLKPSEKLLDNLDAFHKSCVKLIQKKDPLATKKFRHDLNNFEQCLENWKEAMGLKDLKLEEAKKILKDAPWNQYQTTQANGFEEPKNQKLQKKKKLQQYISRITDKELQVDK